MNNNIKIIVYEKYKNVIRYLINNNIKYESLKENNENIILVIDNKYYKNISIRFKTKIINYYGIKFILKEIIENKYLIISFIISMLLLKMLTNTIYEINIYSDDNSLKETLHKELETYDIDTYKRKKNYKELSSIKKEILNNHKNDIEWLEIKENGCIYEIYITPRILKEEEKIYKNNNIIASKEGVIKSIIVNNGTKLKEVNDFVYKDEIVISSEVYKDDKLVYLTNAEGKVYAETWYTVSINMPYKFTEYEYTGKKINHYYIKIKDKKFTILGKYNGNDTINETKLVLDKPYLFFKLYKETKKKYIYREYNLSKEEAYDYALKKSEETINKTLNKDEYVISKKVLKKEVNSSKIYVEVFFKVYENIGVEKELNND